MSDNLKHTPWPWFNVEFSGFYMLMDVDFYDANNLLNIEESDSAEANAKLAASAPELLESCIELLKAIDKNRTDGKIILKAAKAIKKATE